jgi:hypothetical protein
MKYQNLGAMNASKVECYNSIQKQPYSKGLCLETQKVISKGVISNWHF